MARQARLLLFTFLTSTVNEVTVQIGNSAAKVVFAGLTPGLSGLYQINAVVPSGASPNNTTSLQISVAGQTSGVVTFAVAN